MTGRDLSDDETLREIAAGAGLERRDDRCGAYRGIGDPPGGCRRCGTARDGRDRGALFIIGSDSGERQAVSGAQGADALLDAMRQVQAAS
jgi:hypothetical protein